MAHRTRPRRACRVPKERYAWCVVRRAQARGVLRALAARGRRARP
jgi:hypothetical protein